MNELLQRGIALARAGRRSEARALLMQAVEADERSESAWLWLSGVIDEPDDIRVCLENVLAINPQNPQARQGLEWLDARYGPREPEPLPTDIQPVLPSEEPEPEPIPEPVPVLRVAEVPLAVEAPAEPDSPCPYCGAPASLGQRNCIRCKQSLMIRDQPRAKRSIWLTILGGLHYTNAVFVGLAGVISLAFAVVAYQARQLTSQGAPSNGAVIALATAGVILLILAGAISAIGRGLLRRAQWAYFIMLTLTSFGLFGSLLQLGDSGVLNALAGAVPRAQRAQVLGAAGAAWVNIFSQLLGLGLAAASYRDFFGPMRRFLPSFNSTEHAIHYNNGVAYKNRGMWYMAMREWEMAVSRAPFDLNYLHGLGLAYAQLGRFDQARTTLEKALSIAPAHRQISESRALVEQMAAKSKG